MGGKHILGPTDFDGPEDVGKSEGLFRGDKIEKNESDGFDYIGLSDLEVFELPPDFKYFNWKEDKKDISVDEKYISLLSWGFDIPTNICSENGEVFKEDRPFVHNAYYLFTLFEGLHNLHNDYLLSGRIDEKEVKRILRIINSRIDERVEVKWNTGRLPKYHFTVNIYGEYLSSESKPKSRKDMVVSKDKMLLIRDIVLGPFFHGEDD